MTYDAWKTTEPEPDYVPDEEPPCEMGDPDWDSKSTCTCPPSTAAVREGDKECPEHGLDALARELDGMTLYVLDDGFKCFARTKADAERCRARRAAVTA